MTCAAVESVPRSNFKRFLTRGAADNFLHSLSRGAIFDYTYVYRLADLFFLGQPLKGATDCYPRSAPRTSESTSHVQKHLVPIRQASGLAAETPQPSIRGFCSSLLIRAAPEDRQ